MTQPPKRDSARPRTKYPKPPGYIFGRPTSYTDAIANRICAQIAIGRALVHICKAKNMPSVGTVIRWLASRDDFRISYERARHASADFYAETITDIARRALAGEVDPQAARVAIDAYKWTASKLKPKVYGDNRQIDVNAVVDDRRVLEAPGWVKDRIQSSGVKPLALLEVDAETGEVEPAED